QISCGWQPDAGCCGTEVSDPRQMLSTTSPNFHGGARSRTSPRHPLHSTDATRRWMTCLRIAGSVARCVVSLRRGFIFDEPQVLEEREGDHREQGVMVKPGPRAALEVIQPKLFLHLLVRLLARPPSLERADDFLV